MKKAIFGLMVTVLAFGLVASSSAAVFLPGPTATLSGQAVNSNVYGGGGTVNINSEVNGDAYLAGGSVMVNSKIDKDLGVAGGNIFVYNEIGDDLRAIGGSVFINSKIGGETMIGAGQVTLSPNSILGKGAYIAGGMLIVDGVINGDLNISGDKVEINGTVNGNVNARGTEITVGPKAVITGALKYKATKETVVPGTAKVGSVEFTKIEGPKKPERAAQNNKGAIAGLIGALVFFKMLLSLVFVLVLFLVFRKGVTSVTLGAVEGFWKKVLTGFVVMVVAPIAMIMAAITIIGLPFAGFAFGLFVLVSCLASAFSGVLLGCFLFYVLPGKEKGKYNVTWVTVVVGIILLAIIRMIPVIGWLVCAVLYLAVFGQLWTMLYDSVKRWR